VDRGRATWADFEKTTIRFLDDAEVVLRRQLQSEMQRDALYWHDIAIGRGGDDLVFEWQPSMTNGSIVMGARPVAIQKRSQVAHVAPGGEARS
jgi:hypothetical protein